MACCRIALYSHCCVLGKNSRWQIHSCESPRSNDQKVGSDFTIMGLHGNATISNSGPRGHEIEVLQKLSSKSEYVINYLDSFSTDLPRYRIYHIVTDLYKVKYSSFESFKKDKYHFLLFSFIKGWHFRRSNRRQASHMQRTSI